MSLRKIIRYPRLMLWALVMEGVETQHMVRTFVKQGKVKLLPAKHAGPVPTEEELKRAKDQLKDIPRFLPFLIIIVAPVPGITEGYAIIAITLEKWLGYKFSLLPSQIRDVFTKGAE